MPVGCDRRLSKHYEPRQIHVFGFKSGHSWIRSSHEDRPSLPKSLNGQNLPSDVRLVRLFRMGPQVRKADRAFFKERRTMYARISAFLVMLAFAFSGVAAAQETTGSSGGQVVDAQGLAVPGASVTVTGPQGARTVVTDGEGRFAAPFLTPGVYTVRVELQGFKASEQKDIQVSLSQRREVNVKLETGGLTETVQVTGSAPILDTRSTTTGAVLDTASLANIPVGRTFAQALYLTPG